MSHAGVQSTVTWVGIAQLSDVPEGEMLALNVGGKKLALYHLDDGDVRVSDNVCTHEYALLTDGWLEGCEIECPLHAGRFDLRTGEGLCAPIERDLKVYPVEIRDGEVFAALPDQSV
jgi:nitrite reductase/ring-hydroxylating ferredoxin subunit